MTVRCFTFNPFEENTYVLSDDNGAAIIVDPGCYERAEEDELSAYIGDHKLKVELVLNTHGHIDHVLGNYYTTNKYGVQLVIGKDDEATLRSAKLAAHMYGVHNYTEVLPASYLSEGDIVNFGSQKLKVLFLPGHAPGHIGFLHEREKVLIGGDVLFRGSIGRTDLPGGNFDVLIDSIHKKLFVLPDELVVYPGHGPATTIGEEKVSNPFCALTLR